jgi:Holliday junction DNA helicase RuvA
MIAAVSGRVLARRPDHVVIDAGGVGYKLMVSTETLKAVSSEGEDASLHAHLVARDDSLTLFGFAGEDERALFCQLISVSGVGPKVAIAVLSGGTTPELVRAIATGDAKRFQAVPGIGKRTAERIIVELREKIAGQLSEDAVSLAPSEDDPRALARAGLVGLGYAEVEAEQLLEGAVGDTTEELIGSALRLAGSGSREKEAA